MNLSKQDALDLLMLLSALESWAFSVEGARIPVFLHERIGASIKVLSEFLIEDKKDE